MGFSPDQAGGYQQSQVTTKGAEGGHSNPAADMRPLEERVKDPRPNPALIGSTGQRRDPRAVQMNSVMERYRDIGAKYSALSPVEVRGVSLPTTSAISTSDAQVRQMAAADLALNAARGQAPSVAQQQLAAGQAANARQALALAASARGGAGNQVAALREAMRTNAASGQDLNAQMGMLRAQELAQARADAVGATNALRGQDLTEAQFNRSSAMSENALQANLDAQRFGQNAQFEMANRGFTYGAEMAALGGEQKTYTDEQAYWLGRDQIETQRYGIDRGVSTSMANLAFQREQADNANMWQGIGTVAGMAGTTMLAFSDERLKTDKSGIDTKAIDSFLGSVKPKSFEYRDPAFGQGRHFGVMAQDLERSQIGDSLVVDTPAGKMVDLQKTVPTLLATVAAQNERIKALEGSRR